MTVRPAWVNRMTPPDSAPPARPKPAVKSLITCREVPLRDKMLAGMLCKTCARAEEILGVNISAAPNALYYKAERVRLRNVGGRAHNAATCPIFCYAPAGNRESVFSAPSINKLAGTERPAVCRRTDSLFASKNQKMDCTSSRRGMHAGTRNQ